MTTRVVILSFLLVRGEISGFIEANIFTGENKSAARITIVMGFGEPVCGEGMGYVFYLLSLDVNSKLVKVY